MTAGGRDERLTEAGRDGLQWTAKLAGGDHERTHRSAVPGCRAWLRDGRLAARADIYTWTDRPAGSNISNVAPPEGARVTSVLHEAPKPAAAAAARRHRAATRRAGAHRPGQATRMGARAREAPAAAHGDLRGGAAATAVSAATVPQYSYPEPAPSAELWLRMRSIGARLRVRVVAMGLPGEHRRGAKPGFHRPAFRGMHRPAYPQPVRPHPGGPPGRPSAGGMHRR